MARFISSSRSIRWNCSATPCRFRFDAWYFDATGGEFVDSKRLTEPVVATVSKSGFQERTITLTEQTGLLSFPLVGFTKEVKYYWFDRTVFTAVLNKTQ